LDCIPIDPCMQRRWQHEDLDTTFRTFGNPTFSKNDTRIEFHVVGHDRLDVRARRDWLHHHAAMCMYSNMSALHGDFVGYLNINLDGADVQAFVCFVCFFGVALPLICMMTLLIHANKLKRVRMRAQAVRLRHQRIRLEEELGGTGLYTGEPEGAEADADARGPLLRPPQLT